jgi:hypothetical protein
MAVKQDLGSTEPRLATSSDDTSPGLSGLAPKSGAKGRPSFLSGEYGPMIAVLICAVLLGLIIGGDYGESWDEYGDFRYGEDSLQAYVHPDQFSPHFDQGYYGPFYLMLASVSSDILPHIRPGWTYSDGRHYSNYLTFVTCAFFFYLIMRRFTGRPASLGATLLFLLQPLLFGHSFINQKDIPFMAAFTASVALGLVATDKWRRTERNEAEGEPPGPTRRPRVRSIVADWETASWQLRTGLALATIMGVLVAVDAVGRLIILPLVLKTVSAAYAGTATPFINQAFRLVAQDAYKTAAQLYLEKAQVAYAWVRIPLVLLAFIPAVVLARRMFEASLDAWGRVSLRQYWALLLAGGALGLCTSVRVAGPLAGMLVSLAFVLMLGRRSVWPLIVYWSSAILVTLATWPYLWADPVRRLWDSLRVMSDFGSHLVLYDGKVYSSLFIPWHYLPKLTAVQLTLPAVLLGLAGLLFAAVEFRGLPERRPEIAIIGLWIGIPAVAVMAFHRPLYGTFRQVLFVIPPVLVLAGLALGKVLAVMRSDLLRAGTICLIVFPGITGIARLHPYEYIYYNSLVGGTGGAAGRYELDYWCTSYREAAKFVNQVAQEGARVAVAGPDAAFITYVRRDLNVRNSAIDHDGTPDYAVACGQALGSASFYPGLKTVFQVKRGAAKLAVVKSK